MWCADVLLTHLTEGEDAQAAGTLVLEEAPDEILVVRLFHRLHYVLQGVADVWLLKQGEDELAAPPAGQVVESQQTPAHPLQTAHSGDSEGLRSSSPPFKIRHAF